MVFDKGGISIILTVLFYLGEFSLGLVFLFSVFDKIKNTGRHINSLREYRILSENLITIGFTLVILFEVMISFILFFWHLNLFIVIICGVVLLLFSIAVIKNIITGNTNISCGCGGILENDTLHFGIIYRNIFMILVISILFIVEHNNILLNITLWVKLLIFLTSISLIFIIIIIGKEFNRLITKRNVILKYFN
ncbi:MauE/DoxX family redox-associated membrane protein [Neobacillus sp. OS1-2]|uniref:MauE/DoxX family redox-associated membrane protein n=1 Tax=Neobacillus sp. OS1-2 TaxID=3070680 RepID=UPI0035A60188